MAYVTEMSESRGNGGSRRHRTCTAGWHVAEHEGRKVLQIDTYGSPDRQDAGTVSQSLQLDRERAQQLVKVIQRIFPGIV
jgi:hypothetical protein